MHGRCLPFVHTGLAARFSVEPMWPSAQHYMSALETDAPPEWRGKFINYKALKKLLKACR